MEKRYRVELTATSQKFIERVERRDKALYRRLVAALSYLETDPFAGKPLGAEAKGKHSYRVGSYRVIYSVVRDRLIVYVIAIGHRREVYRKLN